MKDRILLAGGSGYLGNHLEQYLSEEFEVAVTGTQKKDLAGYFQVDFLDPESFKNIANTQFDVIVVLAASLKGIGKNTLLNKDLEVNTIKLASFLQFVVDHKLAGKIIYISSMTVYAPATELPVKENHERNPLSVYGLSKKIGEDIVAFLAAEQNVKALTLRLPGVYGGNRTSGFIYNTVAKAVEGKEINVNTQGLGYWECIEINDLCKAITALMGRYEWQEKYAEINVGYGQKTDFIDTAQLIHALVGSKAEINIGYKDGYTDFYMDNTKISKFISLSGEFEPSLKKYVLNLSNELRNR